MQLPGPIRAAVGLAATAVTEARHLPDRAIELPMLAVSTALQASLRLQQRYAALTVRGDEVLNRSRPGEEPPAWATFDDDVPGGATLRGSTVARTSASAASALVEQLFGTDEPAPSGAKEEAGRPAARTTEPRTPPVRTAATEADGQAGASRPAARTAKKAAPAKRAAKPAAKPVNKPRHTAPSKFDSITDPDTDD